MSVKIITANRLSDGAVVYLGAGGAWHEDIDGAAVASLPDSEAALLAIAGVAVRARAVVAPYAIAVERRAHGLAPIGPRERIRAYGPSVDAGAGAAVVKERFVGWSQQDVSL